MSYHRTLILLSCLGLVGCMSAPKPRFYTLDMTTASKETPSVNFLVERVDVADALQRDAIMVKTTPTTVEYYAADLWAAGLHELIRGKLETEFGPFRENAPTLAMQAYVNAFEQVDAPAPHVRAAIKIQVWPPDASRYGIPMFSRNYSCSKSIPNDHAETAVIALSQCVEEIAVQFIQDTAHLAERYEVTVEAQP